MQTEAQKMYTVNSDWVTKFEAMQILGIGRTQLLNDISVLESLEIEGFDYERWTDKGFAFRSMTCLIEFRKLCKSKGRRLAIQQISQHMEEYWNEQSGYGSSTSSEAER